MQGSLKALAAHDDKVVPMEMAMVLAQPSESVNIILGDTSEVGLEEKEKELFKKQKKEQDLQPSISAAAGLQPRREPWISYVGTVEA